MGRLSGVADGTRTRDHRDHNPGLYQLSYRHRARDRIAGGRLPSLRVEDRLSLRRPADAPSGGVEEVSLDDDRSRADVQRP